VTGVVHPERILHKGGAQAGDRLVLTKPLGTGVITTALKNGKADDQHVQTAMEIMATLNRHAALAAQKYGAHGMTDVTGYGIVGHGHEMARLSGTNFHINTATIEWMPGALSYGEQRIFPGGQGRNRGYYGRWVDFADGVSDLMKNMVFDPQTSGGLLIAVEPEKADALLSDLKEQGVQAFEIGHVTDGEGRILIS
jgi:selenide,water dikinase